MFMCIFKKKKESSLYICVIIRIPLTSLNKVYKSVHNKHPWSFIILIEMYKALHIRESLMLSKISYKSENKMVHIRILTIYGRDSILYIIFVCCVICMKNSDIAE